MFGFIAKLPKLALIGLVVLLIGFSPEILATIHIDTVPPDIEYTYPYGDIDNPNALTLGEAVTLRLESRASDVNPNNVTCMVWPSSLPPDDFTTVTLVGVPDEVGVFEAPYTVSHDCLHHFMFTLWDMDNNKSTKLAYGEVGDVNGDFYMKDGNDTSYIRVTKDSTVRFNNNTIYFKFVPTSHAAAITRVYIHIVSPEETFDLVETISDAEWNGSSRTLSDGTYTIYGYFVGYGKTYKGLSIVGGVNEEPAFPSEWSTYDWLKILGGALVAIGLIWRK